MEKVKKKRGQVLMLAYFTITFFLILSLPLFNKINSENLIIVRQKLEKEAFYLTEGAVEEAINKFISAIANFQVLPTVSRYPETGTIITTYADSPDLPTGIHVDSLITALEPNQRIITDPDGTSVAVKTYMVNSTCQHPLNNSVTVTISQVIILRLVYTFQHAVFYADDLEILPGPNMTFTGRIHSNKDIYLNSDGNTLTINSAYLRSAANIYNRTKDGRIMDGDVKIKKLGTGSYAEMDGLDSDSPDWLTESQSRWKGTVKNSAHGITKLSTPVVGSIQPDGYYANNAEVKIEDGTIRQGGQVLVEGVDVPPDTIVTDTDFYNNREGKNIRLTNIDLKKLAGVGYNKPDGTPYPNHLPSNGLIYATRNDHVSTEEPGIRLINGSEIYRAYGLTVASNDPLYIQGDYNTVNKKPTAVICDSVNLLSNNWNDANSTKTLSNRTATNTIVNTAFIAGVDNTTSGHYNGGLENYPRLHEGWSGKTLYMRGSFVELWDTQIAQGAWAYGGSQYTAPNRNWDYDTDLNPSNMPPFTPWAVEAQKGAWWKE